MTHTPSTAGVGVWQYSTGDAWNRLTPAAGGVAASAQFLTPAQRATVERVRQARALFTGQHRRYFLEEGRTQYDFPVERVGESHRRPYVAMNVLRLIALKGADLLFGETPLFRVQDPEHQERLSALVERSSLHERLYDAAVMCGAEAEIYLEACRCGGEVYLRVLAADEAFGVGAMRPDGQYTEYKRFRVANAGDDRHPLPILLEATYAPGVIGRRVWQLDDRANRKVRELDVAAWEAATGVALEPLTETGVEANTITWVPNHLDGDRPVSDFDGLLDLQDELNAKQTQIGRILAKHSNPKIAFPESSADDSGNVRADHEAFFGDKAPQYITWDAQLDAAFKDRDFTLRSLLVLAEMSPSLLGIKEGAAPDAARKLRLEATNALTKAQRKGVRWRPRVRRAVAVALEMERVGGVSGVRRYGYDPAPAAVQMQDGLPEDALDRANEIATLRGARVLSRHAGVERLVGGDPEAVAKELARLDAEDAAAAPSLFLPPATMASGDTGDGRDETDTGVAA